MELKLDIPSDLEPSLRAAADREGVDPAQWANTIIERQLRMPGNGDSALLESERLRKSALERIAQLSAMDDPHSEPQQFKSSDFSDYVVEKLRKQGLNIEM